MSTKKKPAPLRDQIIAFLQTRTEATAKQITASTTERDFPSRVTTELNKMRTDAIVECDRKPGKNELWYWLSQPAQSGNTQPAEVKITGSSASGSTPLAEGAAVQSNPAPATAAVSTAAPVAADVKPKSAFNAGPRDKADAKADYSLMGVLADIRAAVGDTTGKIMLSDLAEHIRLRLAELNAAPAALRAELKKADDELAEIQAALAGRVYIVGDLDELPTAAACATRAAAVIDQLTSANREQLNAIACASETLAEVVSSAIDTSDMDIDELAKMVVGMLAANRESMDEQASGASTDMRDVVSILASALPADSPEPRDMHPHEIAEAVVARLANQTALVKKLEHLLKHYEAEQPRAHTGTADSVGYIVLPDLTTVIDIDSAKTAAAGVLEAFGGDPYVCAVVPVLKPRKAVVFDPADPSVSIAA